MKCKFILATALALIVLILLSAFLVGDLFAPKVQGREFYLGVEYAYGNQISELKALVDKVKDYTNVFVLGVDMTYNRTLLDESSDYIVNSGLNLIVFFTGIDRYNYSNGYKITNWMLDAQQKYGDKFVGIYKIDEPGGNQLDNGRSQIINDTASYAKTSQYYVGNLSLMINYYYTYTPKIYTADYALNWFDYKSNYTAIFSEFVGNESRQRIIAQDRGAAEAFHRDWGVIVNWKYNQPPYMESGDELYSDLALAYSAGAKYAIIFSYPTLNNTQFGILTQEHFDALKRFWTTLHNAPASFGSNPAQVAYVVPKDYGFGFRFPDDRIWGLFGPDNQSAKIYWDIQTLTDRYGIHLDILYDEPEIIGSMLGNYSQVFYWNQTIT